MDKLCKRCQFKNPRHRACCQVCGNQSFIAVAVVGDKVVPVVTTPTEKPENETETASYAVKSIAENAVDEQPQTFWSNLMADCEQLGTKLKSAWSKLILLATAPAKHAEEPADVAMKMSVTVRNRIANTPARSSVAENLPDLAARANELFKRPDTESEVLEVPPMDVTSRKERLEELLQWFKTYGAENLILQPLQFAPSEKQPAQVTETDSTMRNAA